MFIKEEFMKKTNYILNYKNHFYEAYYDGYSEIRKTIQNINDSIGINQIINYCRSILYGEPELYCFNFEINEARLKLETEDSTSYFKLFEIISKYFNLYINAVKFFELKCNEALIDEIPQELVQINPEYYFEISVQYKNGFNKTIVDEMEYVLDHYDEEIINNTVDEISKEFRIDNPLNLNDEELDTLQVISVDGPYYSETYELKV